LLIDVFFWFSNKMLSTLTTLKKNGEWYLVQQKNKMLQQKRFFRVRITFCHSLLAEDGTFKLDYASVILSDPAVQIDKT